MTGNSWPVDAPSPVDHEYLCFGMRGHDIIDLTGKVITEEQAAAQFEQRAGYPPGWKVVGYCGYAWFGPAEKP